MFPRKIDPSTIEVGDTITVTLPKRKGISQSVTGVVARREDIGKARLYITAEGAVITGWMPGSPKPHVYLLARADVPQEELDFGSEPWTRG